MIGNFPQNLQLSSWDLFLISCFKILILLASLALSKLPVHS